MKKTGIKYLIILLIPLLYFSFCYGSNPGLKNNSKINKKEMAARVKKEFLHAWNCYKKYAWGHDALKPLSKSFHDWYSHPLLLTPVDAFDTMVLMGLLKEAEETKKLIFDKLNFDLDINVHHFEISIRVLGGLLSAYQLDHDKRFLDLATNLADRMINVFNSKTGMPYRNVNLKTGKAYGDSINTAEIGTCILEYGVLSKLTGNPIYYEKTKKAMVALFDRRSKLDLVGLRISVATGEWVNKSSHIGGGIDSYFEYLLKGSILFDDNDLRQMWNTSVKAVNKYLIDSSYNGFWYGHVNMDTGIINKTRYGALDAFFAAVLAKSGDLEKAKKLQESNFKMWTLYGIEPEDIDYKTMEVFGGYELRPENIESAYYLYQLTHDEKYLQMGKIMFESIIKYCRTENGYAALKDVKTKTKVDYMESFFLAETLKYAYLLFADEKTLDFKNVIFGTEAHPYRNTWK